MNIQHIIPKAKQYFKRQQLSKSIFVKPSQPMSFFIQTNVYTPEEWCDVFYPKAADGALALGHTAAPYSVETAPPIKPGYEYGYYRFYVFPLGTLNNKLVYGIFSQFNGRRWWVMMSPNEWISPMRFWNGDFPPAGSHPTKFEITKADDDGNWWIFSTLYQRFVCASEHDFTVDLQIPTNECKFKFVWNTSCGPAVPSPIGQPVTQKATYYIISGHGQALTASLTGPVLSTTPLNWSAVNQQFFVRAVATPSIVEPTRPFTYNIYLAEYPNTMLCFEDNGIIGTRTTAGPWEELYFDTAINVFEPLYYLRFRIRSWQFGKRLRATSAGVCSLVSNSVGEWIDDFFVLIPVQQGVPYTY